jgi:NAD+ kinase
MLIKRIGILYHPLVQATCDKAQELVDFLITRNINVWSSSAWATEQAIANLDSTDLIITLGGDGTILRAAQVALEHQIPITGINMGKLGFLTELKANEAVVQLDELLKGKGWLDERTMLKAEFAPAGPNNSPTEVFHALNDVVLTRGEIVKLIQVNTSINDKPLTNYRADGIILATATGSTGYSLSAGGPILHPQSKDLLLVPVVSHLSVDYSLVLPPTSVVKLQLVTENPATLSIDGHVNIPVTKDSLITVRQSTKKSCFLRLHDPDSFYNVLEEKLRGKR